MKDIIEPVDTDDGLFHDGDPSTGVEGTIVSALIMNAMQGGIISVQRELKNILQTADINIDENNDAQVIAALRTLFQPLNNTLTAFATLATGANKLPYFTGPKSANLADLTEVGRDILAKTSTDAILEYLGLGDANGYVGRKIAEKWITASGTYTPTPGTKRIRVTIIGGGGGGGSGQGNSAGYVSAGSGGGAGGVARKTIDVTSVSSVSVTIGSGGNPGVFSSNHPGDGGTTSFGSYMTAGGGGRGSNCGSVAFGVTQLIANGGGGVGSGGDINTIGGSGGPAIILGQGYTSGGGGNSIVAGGGQPIATTASVSGIDGSYGSGGSGAYILASGSEKNGGRGGAGVCIVEEYA